MSETDLFGFTKEGFHDSYSKLTRPPTREQKLAALDAERESYDAAKSAAARGVVSGVPTRGTATAATATSKTDEVKAMSKEDRDAYMDALFSVQYEKGEYESTSSVDDSDTWDGE